MIYTRDFYEGKITTLSELVASCAKSFFHGEQVPRSAKELFDKQGRRDYKKELAELTKEYDKYNSHDAFLVRIKKEKENLSNYIEKCIEGNKRVSDILPEVTAWEAPEELQSLKNNVIIQLEDTNIEIEPLIKRVEYLDSLILFHEKDPYSFNLHFQKALKVNENIINNVRKEQEADEKLEADTQKWLDSFYNTFPDLLVKNEPKDKKKDSKKEEVV